MKKMTVLLMAAALLLPQNAYAGETLSGNNSDSILETEVETNNTFDDGVLLYEAAEGSDSVLPSEDHPEKPDTEYMAEDHLTDPDTENTAGGLICMNSDNDAPADLIFSDPGDDPAVVSFDEIPAAEIICKDTPVERESVPLDAAHFPDAIFRSYVSEAVDSDHDEVLSPQEIESVIYVNVNRSGVHSLDGIQYFPDLCILECSDNAISSIDLTKNPDLYRLFIDHNHLEQLLVNENNKSLRIIDCSDNRLHDLDLSALSCLEIELNCSSNQLVSLKVPSSIKALNAAHNHLVCFDITDLNVTTAWIGTSSQEHYYNLENNEHLIPRVFDLTALSPYGFEPDKVTDWYGGSLNGTVLTITGGNSAQYRYNIGKDAEGNDRYQIFTFITNDYSLRKDDDGKWRVYSGSVFADDYTGLIRYDGSEFFIANGVLCSEANGLQSCNGKWYFLSKGQVQTQWTGLAEYDGHWFYIENGVLNEDANGLYPYDGGYFLLAAGKLQDQYNGLWQNSFPSPYGWTWAEEGAWYFLAKGQVQTHFSGIAMYDGAFFVVEDGRFRNDYNGTVDYDNHTFSVANGQLSRYPLI